MGDTDTKQQLSRRTHTSFLKEKRLIDSIWGQNTAPDLLELIMQQPGLSNLDNKSNHLGLTLLGRPEK